MDHQALAQMLGNYGEFVGAIAVVATLAYLAIQINQNNTLLKAQIRTVRAQIRMDAFDHLAGNPDLARARVKQRSGDGLTEFDEQILRASALAMFTRWQYVFGEWQAGLLEESEVPVRNWRFILSDGSANRDIWEQLGEISFRPDFVKWMESNVVRPIGGS